MIQLITLCLLWFGGAAFSQPNDPALVSVSLSKAYLPVGFDSNDLPQILVAGQFADLCYQVGTQEVKVDAANLRIIILQKAYRYTGNHCWALKVPFEQVTNLPPLSPGDYEVWDGNGGGLIGKLAIAQATYSGPGTDDFPYAPLGEVTLSPRTPFGHNVVVSGVFPNDCLSLREVRVDVQRDVVVVLPILQFTPTVSGTCTAGYYPFRKEQALTQLLGQHPYLLHARSMNGQAINRLVDPYKKFPVDPVSPPQ
jgi:hypothetical protein